MASATRSNNRCHLLCKVTRAQPPEHIITHCMSFSLRQFHFGFPGRNHEVPECLVPPLTSASSVPSLQSCKLEVLATRSQTAFDSEASCPVAPFVRLTWAGSPNPAQRVESCFLTMESCLRQVPSGPSSAGSFFPEPHVSEAAQAVENNERLVDLKSGGFAFKDGRSAFGCETRGLHGDRPSLVFFSVLCG